MILSRGWERVLHSSDLRSLSYAGFFNPIFKFKVPPLIWAPLGYPLVYGKNVKINAVWADDGSLKDGASFCYCAYVLRISGYSGFLRNLSPNTTIFLRGL